MSKLNKEFLEKLKGGAQTFKDDAGMRVQSVENFKTLLESGSIEKFVILGLNSEENFSIMCNCSKELALNITKIGVESIKEEIESSENDARLREVMDTMMSLADYLDISTDDIARCIKKYGHANI